MLGLNRPSLGPDRRFGLWTTLESLPTPRRNVIIENLRLQQVYDAIYTTSLDIALAETPIGEVRRWFAKEVLGETDEFTDATGPQRIRAMLQQLGPTYVKIGQMAASRGDILPPELGGRARPIAERGRPPFKCEDGVTIVTARAGRAARRALRDDRPRRPSPPRRPPRSTCDLPDGTPVVVKVQRPHDRAPRRRPTWA